jgi:DNA-binding CsgD family transcriptional regulator
MVIKKFSTELILSRYGNGITLIKPTKKPNPEIHAHSVEKISQASFSIYFANTAQVSIQCNEIKAASCGFSSVKQYVGKHWYHYFDKKNIQPVLMNCRNTILNNIHQISYENVPRNDGICQDVLNIRMPWYDENYRIIGLFGCAILIGKNSLDQALTEIKSLGLLNDYRALQMQQLIGTKFNAEYLSKREWDCLHLTLRGKTAKQIAKILQLSHWTVQEYLCNLKLKLKVKNKTELIDKTFDYLYCQLNSTRIG